MRAKTGVYHAKQRNISAKTGVYDHRFHTVDLARGSLQASCAISHYISITNGRLLKINFSKPSPPSLIPLPPIHSLDGLVESLLAVCSKRHPPHLGAQEHVDLPLQRGRAREQPRRQPQQLPALLLTATLLVICQLLDNLTIHLISQRFLEGKRLGYVIIHILSSVLT